MVSFSSGQEAARRLLEGPQRYTCLAGGTRSGKTFLIVRSIVARALKAPGSRHAILRFHANAARASIALDTLPNVAKLCFPALKLKQHRQDGFFELPNKSRIWIGGLDDKERVEKILGLEYVSIFLNEASQIPYASALVAFTRLAQKVDGLKQRTYVDLNPVAKSHWTNLLFGEKRDPLSMQKLADPKNYARHFLNPVDNADNLAPEFLESLANLPERQRKRFYEGVYVDELEAALWSYEIIETTRCAPADIPESARVSVVVAVDPSGAAGRDDLGADEIGVIVAARGTDGDCYVIADRSCREAPAVWGGVPSRRFTNTVPIASSLNRISAARWCAPPSTPPIPMCRCGLSRRAAARRCAPSRSRCAMRNARCITPAASPSLKTNSAPSPRRAMAAPAAPTTPTRRSGR